MSTVKLIYWVGDSELFRKMILMMVVVVGKVILVNVVWVVVVVCRFK